MFVNATDDQNKKPIHYCMKMNLFLDRSKFFFLQEYSQQQTENRKKRDGVAQNNLCKNYIL